VGTCLLTALNLPPDRFSLITAARTVKYGLGFGLVYGGVQDAIGFLRGRRIGYIEFARRRFQPKDLATPDMTPEQP
jgi:hypothetical protein